MLRPQPRRDETITLPDGRTLAYAEWGDATGTPVFLFHGSPDSRLFSPDTYPTRRKSRDLGARLITVDRPGYGRSDPLPGLTLLGWVDDFARLADGLGLDRFAVTGASGGGPYAMAVGVRMPERVSALGLVSTMGPDDDVPGGVVDSSPEARAQVIATIRRDPFAAVEAVAEREKWMVESPEAVADPAKWPAAEQWLFADPEIPPLLLLEHAEAARQGVVGSVWDWIARKARWGFSPGDLGVPTFLWHGDRDEIVPLAHFEYLARTIPSVHAVVWAGEGHTGLLQGDRWGEVLDALVGVPVAGAAADED
jgi:pimeloyl-ACP methyl ester carboxylesterase